MSNVRGGVGAGRGVRCVEHCATGEEKWDGGLNTFKIEIA